MNHVYVALKKRYPMLPAVNTIQVETYHENSASQDLLLKQVMFFTDWGRSASIHTFCAPTYA